MLVIPCAGQDFHSDGVARRNSSAEQFVDALANRRPRVAEKLYPGGSIDQYQDTRSVRMTSRSPLQPEPRNLRADSTGNGSAARVRKAKLIASRFVLKR